MKTPDKTVEEIVDEFGNKFVDYIKTIEIGQYNDKGVNIGFKTAYNLMKEHLTQTLQAERQKREQELQKAREEERERCIKVVDDYGKSMRELHNKMIGNAHEDSKMILAFDMHSRLIAIKHITEKMNQSELDQPTDADVLKLLNRD